MSCSQVLDEVQTYILMCRCLGDAQKLTDSDLVQKVMISLLEIGTFENLIARFRDRLCFLYKVL